MDLVIELVSAFIAPSIDDLDRFRKKDFFSLRGKAKREKLVMTPQESIKQCRIVV